MKAKGNWIPSCLMGAVLLLLPLGVQAQFTFTTNNGAITITGYTGAGGDVTIPDTINGFPVTGIGQDAFYQIDGLTSVTIGTNVTTIGTNAFFQCTSLAGATIPGSVTNIGPGPFVDCQSLTVISVSASNLDFFSTNELLFNKSQTSLIQYPGGIGGSYTLPAAVTNVGEAFIGNTLTNLSVNSASLYYSGTNGVLFDKNQIALIAYPGGLGGSYAVPRTVSTVVSASFEYSTGVASVTIGTNVTSIGANAFYDCASLTAISVNATNSYYSSTNGVLFDKMQATLIQYPSAIGGSYTIPGTVTNIGDGAFGDAFSLTGVVIPNSVTSMGQEVFYSCEGLASVMIGTNLTSIGQQAFYYCTNLTGITIPGSVTNLGEYAFFNCSALNSVTFTGNAPDADCSVFSNDNNLSVIDYYLGTTGWGPSFACIPTQGLIVPLVVTTTSLTNGTNGLAYHQTLTASGGQPPYSWTNTSGALPPGLTLATNGLISGTPTTNGAFNFTAQVTDTLSETATQALLLTIINLVDTNPPVLSITNVMAGMQWSNAAFTVKGTATDNVAVASVSCSLNSAAWTLAATSDNWTNWSAGVTLAPGTNTIAAYAVDTSGNNSLTSSVSLFFVVTNQLQIRATGLGTISPNYSNAWLQIGRNYSITSSPDAGFVFTNWVISTNWLGGTSMNKTNLLFMMASNLTLQANCMETSRPVLAITAPSANQHLTNALAYVAGTARDTNWGVANVWYQLNSGNWSMATTTNVWTNWTMTLPLLVGTNMIKAYAVNLGENTSITNNLSVVSSNTFKLQLAFTNTLPLNTNGLVFSLQLSTGLNGHILVSTNLTTWATLTNFVGTNSTITVRDPGATNSPHRFYRAVIP